MILWVAEGELMNVKRVMNRRGVSSEAPLSGTEQSETHQKQHLQLLGD